MKVGRSLVLMLAAVVLFALAGLVLLFELFDGSSKDAYGLALLGVACYLGAGL
jgi:hypothetical protein